MDQLRGGFRLHFHSIIFIQTTLETNVIVSIVYSVQNWWFFFSIGHFGALQIAPQFDELSCVGKVDGALMVVHVIDRCCHFFIVFGRPDQCVLGAVFDREEVVEILRTTPNAQQNNP